MRIAQVVQVNRPGVMRLLQVRRENSIQRPLLQHQLSDAQLHRLGVVIDDIAVLEALGIHQPVHKLTRHAIDRQVAQLVAIATQRQFIVQHFADQRAVHTVHTAGDDLVLDRLGDVQRHLPIQIGVLHQRVDQFLAIPRQRTAPDHIVNHQHARIRQVHRLAVPRRPLRVAHPDPLPRQLAVLPEPLVRRHDRRIPLLRQHDFNQILHVLDVRNPPPLLVRRHMVFAARIGQLLNHQVRHLLRHRVAHLHMVPTPHLVRRPVNRLDDLLPAERNHQPVALAKPVECHCRHLVHCLPSFPGRVHSENRTVQDQTGPAPFEGIQGHFPTSDNPNSP